MAALVLARAGHRVEIFERMPSPARKFLMAGRGGLNLTHSEPLERLLTRYPGAPTPILEAIRRYPPERWRAFALELGQETFVGTSGRVFPKAMKASPMLRAWLVALEAAGVVLRSRHDWLGLADDGAHRFVTPAGEQRVQARASLLALGGASWPRLGATGTWQGELARWGVTTETFQPSNVGILVRWSAVLMARHAGAPLKRIALRIGEKTVRGEAILTRDGLEGGAIYALSAAFRTEIAKGQPVPFVLDLRPDLPTEEIFRRLSKTRAGDSLANQLRKSVQLSPVAIALLHEAAPEPLKVMPATRIADLIRNVPLIATGQSGLDRAISSAGGVIWSEIDPDFMLKRKPGIFVAGEMLDWDAPTGGYLLQATAATAIAAAQGVQRWLADHPAAGAVEQA